MKKKIIALSSMAICIILIVIGITSAYFTSKDSVTNVINTGSIKADPEEYVEGTTKKVWVKNTGKNECLVRVSITPRWLDSAGNPWAGDVNKVELIFKDENGKTNLISPDTTSEWGDKKWIKGNDEYYYYTSTLPVYKEDVKDEPGVTVGLTSELLSSVVLKDGITDEYKDKTLKIDVKVESVQTTQSAYATVWDMDLAGQNIRNLLGKISY